MSPALSPVNRSRLSPVSVLPSASQTYAGFRVAALAVPDPAPGTSSRAAPGIPSSAAPRGAASAASAAAAAVTAGSERFFISPHHLISSIFSLLHFVSLEIIHASIVKKLYKKLIKMCFSSP